MTTKTIDTVPSTQEPKAAQKNPVGAVLVCGGGIAGIQASLDLSAAGFYVYLVEESPTIGGNMAQPVGVDKLRLQTRLAVILMIIITPA